MARLTVCSQKGESSGHVCSKKSFSTPCHLLFCLFMSSKAAGRQCQQQRPQAAPILFGHSAVPRGEVLAQEAAQCSERGTAKAWLNPLPITASLPLPSNAVMQHHLAGDQAFASQLIKIINCSPISSEHCSALGRLCWSQPRGCPQQRNAAQLPGLDQSSVPLQCTREAAKAVLCLSAPLANYKVHSF